MIQTCYEQLMTAFAWRSGASKQQTGGESSAPAFLFRDFGALAYDAAQQMMILESGGSIHD